MLSVSPSTAKRDWRTAKAWLNRELGSDVRPDDERWPRVKALFQAAAERPAEERAAFLTAATGEDAALRREVESLLTWDASDASALDSPVPGGGCARQSLRGAAGLNGPTASHPVLAAGLGVGPYEIVASLGAGAMGEVYRARDRTWGATSQSKSCPSCSPRSRTAGAVRARSTPARLTQSSAHRRHLRRRGSDGAPALVMELSMGRRSQTDGARADPVDEALPMPARLPRRSSGTREGHRSPGLQAREHQGPRSGMVKVLDFGLAKRGTVAPVDVPNSPR